MKKALYVATVVKTHIMEFHVPYLKMLKDMGWETSVAAKNDYENPEECNIPYCDTYYDLPFERNPLRINNIKTYRILKRIIDEGHYDIIHCHTPMGACIARLAASQARKKGSKVIYTAHGFHFYKGAPLINWLVYYPVEKWLAHKTDVLITINKEDYNRAKQFKAGKVVYIPGVGIDIAKFCEKPNCRADKRKELGIKKEDFVLLSVGELIPRKNHRIVLEALANLKSADKLNNVQYVICGSGVLEKELKELSESLDIADRVRFLGYRSDIDKIYGASDLFVFMSLQEGLPVALMEAMASGLPAICSNIRGNTDLIEDGENGVLIDNTAEKLADEIFRLMMDSDLRNIYSEKALHTISKFDLASIKADIQSIYTDVDTEIGDRGGVINCLQKTKDEQALKKQFGIPLDATVLLSVGELNDNKNHRVVIEALKDLDDCWYVICGRGPLFEEYKRLAKQIDVDGRLVLTGYRDDIECFYDIADVFVFPSLREGLPVAVIEAMAAGLPIVCTNIRGTSDLIKDGVNGFFVDYDNPDSVAKGVRCAIDGRAVISSNNINRVSSYDLNIILRQYKRVYEEAIRGQK